MSGSWPEIEPATDPTLINWANLGKGKIARCGRSTISYIFAILILLGGFLLILVILAAQKDVSVNASECGEAKISFETALEAYQE